GLFVRRAVVVMPTAFWVGAVGLEGVGPPVDEEAEVVRRDAGGRFETVLPHPFLPEVGWLPLFHRGCGRTKKIFRQTADRGLDNRRVFSGLRKGRRKRRCNAPFRRPSDRLSSQDLGPLAWSHQPLDRRPEQTGGCHEP